MTGAETKAEFNRILNNLVRLRDRYDVYSDDWATTPVAVKATVRSRFAAVTLQASTDLAALSADVQGQ